MSVKEQGLTEKPIALPDAPAVSGLSERQLQILGMLRAGKVNKEIASELGIGLGTVKQHVVALFKKLNVRNRAMAVSRGADLLLESRKPLLDRVLLEYRPCVVLSLVLDGNGDSLHGAGRRLQQTMAACAFDHDAIFLARQQNGGDLIFGIQGSSEAMVLEALRAAHQVAQGTLASDELAGIGLHGGIEAGLAVASMYRSGGWSGDAIASSAIAKARALADEAKPGQLCSDEIIDELLSVLGPTPNHIFASPLPFDALRDIPWRFSSAETDPHPLFGRDEELTLLKQEIERAAHGSGGKRIHIEGETGMGKSSLCRAAARHVAGLGGESHFFFCQAVGGENLIHDLADGKVISAATLPALLAVKSNRQPALWILDDSHLISADTLADIARLPLSDGQLLLLTGRRQPELAASCDLKLHLSRISSADTRRIVGQYLRDSDGQVGGIAELAAGVPLFATELAKANVGLPLSLRIVVGGRLDRLNLDRLLMRQVAATPGAWSLTQLVTNMGENRKKVAEAAEQALAAGVLKRDSEDRFHFSHPLLRQTVLHAEVEKF
jgi:DNA-binding CsgD family transcriptional regulator